MSKTSVYLHCEGDRIWSLASGGTPSPTAWSLDRPQDLASLPVGTKTYVLGCRDNLRLIDHLLRTRPHQSLYLASPVDLPAKATPEKALLAARSCDRSAHQGGWHKATQDDRRMYALYAAYLERRDTLELRQAHPVWSVLDFLGIPADLGAWLVTEIIDPRWFVHPRRPDRLSRLRLFMGLAPRFALKMDRPDLPCQQCLRAAQLQRAWQEATSEYFRKIYDEYAERMKGCLAAMRTSQRFLQLLHATWMASLVKHSELFVPDYFFRDGLDARAFESHQQRWRQRHLVSP